MTKNLLSILLFFWSICALAQPTILTFESTVPLICDNEQNQLSVSWTPTQGPYTVAYEVMEPSNPSIVLRNINTENGVSLQTDTEVYTFQAGDRDGSGLVTIRVTVTDGTLLSSGNTTSFTVALSPTVVQTNFELCEDEPGLLSTNFSLLDYDNLVKTDPLVIIDWYDDAERTITSSVDQNLPIGSTSFYPRLTSIESCVTDTVVTFTVYESPTAFAGADAEVCSNTAYTVSDAFVTNDGGFSWTHTGGGTLTNETTLLPTYTPIASDAGTIVTLTLTVNGIGACPPAIDTKALTITAAPNAGNYIGTAGEACVTDQIYSLTALLDGTQDIGGTWTDLDGSGAFFMGDDVDFNMTPPGTYRYVYTVAGTGSCADDTEIITVNVSDFPSAGIYVGLPGEVCTTNTAYTLTSLLDGTQDAGGIWTDDLSSGAVITGNEADFTGVLSGTYAFTYTVSGGGCGVATETVTVIVTDAPNSGSYRGVPGNVCTLAFDYDLSQLLDGTQDPFGFWENLDGSGAILEGDLANFTGSTSGIYEFIYTVSGTGPCPDAQTAVMVEVKESLNAGFNGAISVCNNINNFDLFAVIDGNPDTGGIFTEDIANPQAVNITNTTADFTNVTSGTYLFFYTVSAAGCEDLTSELTVTVIDQPTVNAGFDVEICEGEILNLASAIPEATNFTAVEWITTGDGVFSDRFVLEPTYTPGFNDLLTGTVSLTLQATGTGSCGSVSDDLILSITTAPEIIFPGSATFYLQNGNIDLNLISDQITVIGADVYNWSILTGGGSFEGEGPTSTQLYTVYVPNEATYPASINLELNVINSFTGCTATEFFNFTIYDNPAYNELVNLYNAYEGANWSNNINWLSYGTNIADWAGISVDIDNNVIGIDLSFNNLSGEFPPQILNLPSLQSINLSYNNLGGAIPAVLNELSTLENINLSNNSFTEIFDLSTLPNIAELRIENNSLTDITSLEANAGIPIYTYWPQAFEPLPAQSVIPVLGEMIEISYDTLLTDFNEFQWIKNDIEIAGENNYTYTIPNFSFEDQGLYYLRVSNTLLPDLIFETEPTLLNLEECPDYISEIPTDRPWFSRTTSGAFEVFGTNDFVKIRQSSEENVYIISDYSGSYYESYGGQANLEARITDQCGVLLMDFRNSGFSIDQGVFGFYDAVGDSLVLKWSNTDFTETVIFKRYETAPIANEADSMALVSLFNNLDPENVWVQNTNWLIDELWQWEGIITDFDGRVTEINLPNRNISGTLSEGLTELDQLIKLNISGNFFTDLPDLNLLPNLNSAIVSNNNFDFSDLEPNVNLNFLQYFSQKRFGEQEEIIVLPGESLTFSRSIPGSANEYQWYKNNLPIADQLDTTLNLNNVTIDDNATYNIRVSSSLVPSLVILSQPIKVSVKVEGQFEWAEAGDLTSDGLDARIYSGSWGDFDNDGYQDIMTMGFGVNQKGFLYRNNQDGTFSRMPENTFDFATGRSANWADFDNDGNLDLFMPSINFGSDSSDLISSIYRNLGGGEFERLLVSDSSVGSAVWVDIDDNGMLDLIGHSSINNQTVFNPAAQTPPYEKVELIDKGGQWNISSVDLNNNGHLDLIVPDNPVGKINIYFNNGDGTFTEMTGQELVNTYENSSFRTVAFADIDNDGDYDLYVMNSLANIGVENMFYINDGAGNFTRQLASDVLGENIQGGRAATFADLNNDGFPDLISSFYSGSTVDLAIFINQGNFTFTKLTDQTYQTVDYNLAGVSVADYNNDGFQDFFIGNASPADLYQNTLYRNKGNTNNWLKFDLVGSVSNRSAIGSKIDVYANGNRIHQQIVTTNGSHNQNSYVAHIGMNQAAFADSVIVTWTSGYKQRLTDIPVNQQLSISEERIVAVDSLALVAIYNDLDGDNWVNNSGWFTNDIENWFGLTFQDRKVVEINLPNNNLRGILPAAINDLDQLQVLSLAGNEITGLPENNLTQLSLLDVQNNRLDFGSLEPYVTITDFFYAPQRQILIPEDTILALGTSLLISPAIGGSQNNYQWFKDSEPIEGETATALNLTNLDLVDEAFYSLEVTTDVVDLQDLVVRTSSLELKISTLDRDMGALRIIYNQTGGENWSTPWDINQADINDWGAGNTIIVENNRVVGLDLSNNNVVGDMPTAIRELLETTDIDLSENQITNLPNMKSLISLTRLDVSQNNLLYPSITRNLGIAGFNFENQAMIQVNGQANAVVTVEAGENANIFINTPGAANTYQWFFENSEITGANSSSVTIPSVDFDKMGLYHVEVGNTAVNSIDPNFRLISRAARLNATTTINGMVTDANANPTAAGRVRLFKINLSGAFDTISFNNEKFVTLNAQGEFEMPNVILDDYILFSRPDIEAYPDLLPTYFQNTIDWDFADTLRLRNAIDDVRIILEGTPAEVQGTSVFTGFLEQEVEEEGRSMVRRRVSNAGVSVRSLANTTRENQKLYSNNQLVAYIETDENGEFEFPNLPAGEYLVKIDYPGVPMNESSDIRFTFTGEDQERLEVAALIDAGQISVDRIQYTSNKLGTYKELSVYPNPNSGLFQLNTNERIKSLHIFDLSGQLVYELDEPVMVDQSLTIDVRDQSAGLYFIHVNWGDGTRTMNKVMLK